MKPDLYKGFSRTHLEAAFSVRFTDESVAVPYFEETGAVHREKEFTVTGKARQWLGETKPQIPYGLETLSVHPPIDPVDELTKGATAFLTEGESCAWALRSVFPANPVLGLPGSGSWQREWRGWLLPFPVIYLSFDADVAGTNLLDAVWSDLPWARRVKLPDGLDTRDVLQLHGGLSAYERLLDDADRIAGLTRTILKAAAKAKGALCV